MNFFLYLFSLYCYIITVNFFFYKDNILCFIKKIFFYYMQSACIKVILFLLKFFYLNFYFVELSCIRTSAHQHEQNKGKYIKQKRWICFISKYFSYFITLWTMFYLKKSIERIAFFWVESFCCLLLLIHLKKWKYLAMIWY